MKMNLIISVLCAVLLGYLCSNFIFKEYASTTKSNIYYLQCATYDNLDSSKNKIEGVEDQLVMKEDSNYNAYIGMTTDINIANNIKKMYKDIGVDINIKDSYLDNNDFVQELTQYDILLKESKNIKEVNSVLKTILATFDEIVLNN